MKSFLISVVFLFAGYAQAHDHHHLKFANGIIHAHASWETGPQVSQESMLQIEWKNGADHAPTEPGSFEVVLWMPSMGHGSAPTQIERVLDAQGQPLIGVYRVTNIYFVMGGEWQVQVILNKQGVKETQSFRVSFPESGEHHGASGS